MKKLVILAAALAAMPVLADSFRTRVQLVGVEEVPAVSTTATGEFTAKLSTDGTFMEYELTYNGLQAAVTQAHIHFGQRDANGGIVIWLCGTTANPGPAGTPVCPASGTIVGLITSANVVAVAAQQIPAGGLSRVVAAMRTGNAYVNVHTVNSPGGEIRGQIPVGAFAPGN